DRLRCVRAPGATRSRRSRVPARDACPRRRPRPVPAAVRVRSDPGGLWQNRPVRVRVGRDSASRDVIGVPLRDDFFVPPYYVGVVSASPVDARYVFEPRKGRTYTAIPAPEPKRPYSSWRGLRDDGPLEPE